MKNLMGVNPTNMVRMRLAVVHVSTFEMRVLASANIGCRPTCGKLWVPVMTQTLKTGVAEEHRAFPPMGPVTPPRQMTIYMVQQNRDRLAKQASTPVMMPILMAQMQGWVMIKANQGRGESPREEMTTDENGEREVSELSKAPPARPTKGSKVKGKTAKTGQACVPKCTKVIVSAEVSMVPCDQC